MLKVYSTIYTTIREKMECDLAKIVDYSDQGLLQDFALGGGGGGGGQMLHVQILDVCVCGGGGGGGQVMSYINFILQK